MTVLRYNIRQQDGSLVEMIVEDTKEMRLFVAWVRAYEAAQDQFTLTPHPPAQERTHGDKDEEAQSEGSY